MATRLKEVDAVTVGLGWTGAIMARELTKAGLERGRRSSAVPTAFRARTSSCRRVRDEVRYAQRLELMMDNSIDTSPSVISSNERALPIRRIGAFLPGEGVGGSGIHWGGAALAQSCRPISASVRRSPNAMAPSAIPDDMTIQDWPVSYRRDRAVLRQVRQDLRRVRQGRQSARQARSTAAISSKGRAPTNIRTRRSNRAMPA